MEELQSFTAQWVPHPRWVKVDNVVIPPEHTHAAATALIAQLGPVGVKRVGGTEWWQWRQKGGTELKAEWIEMRNHYNARKATNDKCSRIMLYVHGGGYFFGSVDEHRYQMQRHARKLQARVFAPRYRLAPQFPFPCGLQDCLAAYLYLLTTQKPSEILLAGDSAGAGMVVSMLCVLRDQGFPLPAGAILISPWVDLAHSFPSLGRDDELDYIPGHGFHQKPSAAWPPPNDDEMAAIVKGAVKSVVSDAVEKDKPHTENTAVQGFSVTESPSNKGIEGVGSSPAVPVGAVDDRRNSAVPGPGHQISIEVNGKIITLKDQIQMYATNQLISHPLVSPVLQPSLGGLPPLLVMTGGGELLRDEQIYLAHKAANPAKYPLGNAYRSQYDPGDALLHKYPPTPVQLQVWEDLCHVAPTLSFTRPAKYMYRSIAQFGAWALARAQKTSIEIVDDDQISIISSGSDTDTEPPGSSDGLANEKPFPSGAKTLNGQIGKAGDPIPIFKHHMIRQKVDRHGAVFDLAPPEELAATQMHPDEVGVAKPGPVLKWMDRKRTWDGRYAKIKRKVQKRRAIDLATGDNGFGPSERPPPSALANRRSRDQGISKKRKSLGLSIWSLWGSKHDEHTLKREEEVTENMRKESGSTELVKTPTAESVVLGRDISPTIRRLSSTARRNEKDSRSRSRSRRRTISVTDNGQVDSPESFQRDQGSMSAIDGAPRHASTGQLGSQADSAHLSPGFIPKFKSQFAHLRDGSKDDTSSIRTGQSAVGEIADNASTTAVFAAAGVMRERTDINASSVGDKDDAPKSEASSILSGAAGGTKFGGIFGGADTPSSRRSVERLMQNQTVPDDDKSGSLEGKQLLPMRSPSSVAVVEHPGVVGEVNEDPQSVHDSQSVSERGPLEGGLARQEHPDETTGPGEREGESGPEVHRPGMYDRSGSEFQTAMEVV